ncbi:hypothetical protein PG997_010897 [Apiospora hydei]|uniref:Uncharacterized protein n=1 Tax=Apiospora hydei TaxID=1337664 RepID=A0ABR1VHH7_9PEZI
MGFIDITHDQPHRVNKLSIWVHDLRKDASVAPSSSTLEANDSSDSSPHTTSTVASKPRIQPLFRPLNDSELALLKRDPDTALWPTPKWIVGSWLSQSISEITNNLQDAVGHLTGCAPVTPILLEEKGRENVAKRNPYPFPLPLNMELDEEYRADRIMKGWGSPSQNLRGEPQHWNAKN